MATTLDLTELTPEELRTLLSQISSELSAREQAQQDERSDLTAQISEAVATLEGLIGPEDKEGTAPDLETIVGVLRYSPEDMAANPQLAFPLAFQGLHILAEATLKIARVVGE